jgi:putative transposase
LTYPEVPIVETFPVSRQAHERRRNHDGQVRKFEPHKLELQIPCVVFIPKCRRKTLYGELRVHLGEVFRKLASQKEGRVEEGHLLPDHVHMLLAIRRSTRSRRWWVHEGEERHSSGKSVRRKEAQLPLGNTSGRGGTSSRRSVVTRRSFARTSRSRRKRISDSTSLAFGEVRLPPNGGANPEGPR